MASFLASSALIGSIMSGLSGALSIIRSIFGRNKKKKPPNETVSNNSHNNNRTDCSKTNIKKDKRGSETIVTKNNTYTYNFGNRDT